MVFPNLWKTKKRWTEYFRFDFGRHDYSINGTHFGCVNDIPGVGVAHVDEGYAVVQEEQEHVVPVNTEILSSSEWLDNSF